MADYEVRGVNIKQTFTVDPVALETALTAWIVGPNAVLHRFAEAAEKDAIRLVSYSTIDLGGITADYPGISAGSSVDTASVKFYVENALIKYYEIAGVANPTLPSDTVFAYNVPGTSNAIRFNGFNVKTNGNYLRNSALGTRDVQIGDTLVLTAYAARIPGTTECAETTFKTRVLDYVVDESAGSVGTAIRKTNKGTQTVAITTDVAEGSTAAPAITQSATAYTGNFAEEVYTVNITTVGSSFTYTVDSASGTDSFPVKATAPVLKTVGGTVYNTIAVGKRGPVLQLPEALGTFNYSTVTVTVSSAAIAGSTPSAVNTTRYTTTNSVSLGVHGTYDPKATGWTSQKYLIQVINKTNTNACQNIDLRIVSESGLDDTESVQALLGSVTDGDQTIEGYVFDITSDGSVKGVIDEDDFSSVVVGDAWQYQFTGSYNPTTILAGGSYTGDSDDTYIIQCVQGGNVADASLDDCPKVIVTTATGREYIGPVTLSGFVVPQITTGTGVTLSFSATAQASEMLLGDIYIVRVFGGANTCVKTLLLEDSIPTELRSYSTSALTSLDVKFCVNETIQLPETTTLSGTTYTNYVLNTGNTFTVNGGIRLTKPEFVSTLGAPIQLTLEDGTLYAEYREWVQSAANSLNYITTSDGLDLIPGQLDPSNPLKYGVYKALANSNGVAVAYTAVVDPDSLDSWAAAFDAGSGDSTIYTITPMTQDLAVQNLAMTYATSDSSEEDGAWKHIVVNATMPSSWMVVGQSDASSLRSASRDGNLVFGIITEDSATHKITNVEITSTANGISNADLSSVSAGDELRVFGGTATTDYTSYIVDSVVGDTLSLVSGPSTAVDIPVKLEVWHTAAKNEQIDYIIDYAQSFSDRRAVVVFPDAVGEAGKLLPGYYLCAAIAGMLSGVDPWQGVSGWSVNGFDDYSRVRPYFNKTQLKQLSAGGVWVTAEDTDGTPYNVHAVTSDTTDLNYREEMVTRNIDSISKQFKALLMTYIHRSVNVTDAVLGNIEYDASKLMRSMLRSGQLVAGDISNIAQDELLKDHVNMSIDITVPYTLNNLKLNIIA